MIICLPTSPHFSSPSSPLISLSASMPLSFLTIRSSSPPICLNHPSSSFSLAFFHLKLSRRSFSPYSLPFVQFYFPPSPNDFPTKRFPRLQRPSFANALVTLIFSPLLQLRRFLQEFRRRSRRTRRPSTRTPFTTTCRNNNNSSSSRRQRPPRQLRLRRSSTSTLQKTRRLGPHRLVKGRAASKPQILQPTHLLSLPRRRLRRSRQRQ